MACGLIHVCVSVWSHQLLRKRHIGNDIVTIVFQEPGAMPFTPKSIRSHFQHVFIIVQVHEPCTENTYYRSDSIILRGLTRICTFFQQLKLKKHLGKRNQLFGFFV